MRTMRNIIRIDEDKCDGCGLCASACAEGAIQIINGKAKLVSETYCDGLGACLGECPQGAITMEQREAALFDEKAVEQHLQNQKQKSSTPANPHAPVCPGSMLRSFTPAKPVPENAGDTPSQLATWPVQLSLVPIEAPYFQNADLLLVADCVPFALANFHSRYLRGKPVIIGCPKLDDAAGYVEKLADILASNEIVSLTVIHMEVPCCGGLSRIARAALNRCGKDVPLKDVTIGIRGGVVQEIDETAAIR